MKRCSNCFQDKPTGEFYPNRTGRKGNEFQSYCKDCKRETFRGWKKRKREAPPGEQIKRAELSKFFIDKFCKQTNKGK